jgi:hypothetical protein
MAKATIKLNVKLLNRVKKHLLEEPKRYYQGWWANKATKEDGFEGAAPPACGTQGCIAGWAVFLTEPKSKWDKIIQKTYNIDFGRKARKLLGLTVKQGDALFSADNQTKWTGKAGVKQAVRKIDLLISDPEKFVRKYANPDVY